MLFQSLCTYELLDLQIKHNKYLIQIFVFSYLSMKTSFLNFVVILKTFIEKSVKNIRQFNFHQNWISFEGHFEVNVFNNEPYIP